jgi:hypothetical protein
MRPAPPSRVSLSRGEDIQAAKIDLDLALWALGGAIRGPAAVAAEAEPEPEGGEGKEGADGVEQRIVGRSSAAGDKGLVDFVHDGIAGGDGKSGEAPRPAPAFAATANAAVDQQAKNKIFNEVGAFADDVVNEIKLVFREVRKEPVHDRGEKAGGVLGGEGVSRECEDNAGPGQSRPPGAKPGRKEQLVQARLHLGELRHGARIAPGLFRQCALLG